MRLLVISLATLLAAGSLAFPQDAPEQTKPPERSAQQAPPPQSFDAEVITVKTLTGDSFDRLVRLLDVFGARVRSDSQLRTIVVYAPKSVVDQMRHMVDQLDRPGSEAAFGKNIEMTLTLLRCSTKAPAAAAPLPPDMESVAKQLRAATQYKDIQLWDVVPMRLQEGKDSTEDLRLPGTAGQNAVPTANIQIHPEAIYVKDKARYVRFTKVGLRFRIPVPTGLGGTSFSYENVGLQTSGDFQEGQKTVLGKVSGMDEGDAIFAVVALKVLD